MKTTHCLLPDAVEATCEAISPCNPASFAAARKFDLVDDYKTLIKRPDIDAVAVVTPHQLHEEMAIAALAAVGTTLFLWLGLPNLQ